MRSLLTSRVARRGLRPVADLIDQRVARALRADAASVETLRREVAELRRTQHAVELFLGDAGRGMARTPTSEQVATLARGISRTTGCAPEEARRNVAQAFRALVALETLGVGRIAGGTLTVTAKLATVPLLAPPNGRVLEIGTLYGLFAAGLTRMLQRSGVEVELTIVDPLAGLQLQPEKGPGRADPSGTPVREAAVRENLALAGPSGAAARIRQGLSGDPEVRAEVSDRDYGVIVVDGDHSQAGVRADLEWAEQIVAPGGVVVLDDYGDPSWAGVEQAVKEHLAGSSRFTFLGKVAHAGFLRAS